MSSNNKPKPKPKPSIAPSEVESEAVVEEPTPTPTPAVVVEKTLPTAPPSEPHVIGADSTDSVFLDKAIYKNIHAKKSLTVHHIQRRLNEWGFSEAYTDKDGYYGDRTLRAVADFQKSQGIDGDGLMTAETMMRLFENDQNVTVVIS